MIACQPPPQLHPSIIGTQDDKSSSQTKVTAAAVGCGPAQGDHTGLKFTVCAADLAAAMHFIPSIMMLRASDLSVVTSPKTKHVLAHTRHHAVHHTSRDVHQNTPPKFPLVSTAYYSECVLFYSATSRTVAARFSAPRVHLLVAEDSSIDRRASH